MPSPRRSNHERLFVDAARFGNPAGACDAAPDDLAAHEEQERRESCTALLRRIDAALAERLDGRARNEVMALVTRLAEHATGEGGDPHGVLPEAGDQGPPPHPGAPPMGGMGGRLTADEVDEFKRFLESKGLSAADVETAVRLLAKAHGADQSEGAFLGARPMVGGGIGLDARSPEVDSPNPWHGLGARYRPRPAAAGTALDRALAASARIKHDTFEAGRLAAAARPAPSARGRTLTPLGMDASSAASDDYARMFPGAARVGHLG